MNELLVHATGLAALGLNIKGLLHRNDRLLRKSAGLSALLWALNNFLLGAPAAAALCALNAGGQATTAVLAPQRARLRALACGFLIAVSLCAGALTWYGLPTVLTTTASVAVAFATFYFTGARLRLTLLASAGLWMYHAVVFHSWEQIAANLLVAAAAAWGAWKKMRPVT